MTVQELAWAAGLFEGEGTIAIARPRAGIRRTSRHLGALTVSVASTDTEITAFFKARWSGSLRHDKREGRPQHADAFTWSLSAGRAAAFLRELLPYLRRTRVREKAWTAIAFQEQKSRQSSVVRSPAYQQLQHEFYARMRDLNRRGRPE